MEIFPQFTFYHYGPTLKTKCFAVTISGFFFSFATIQYDDFISGFLLRVGKKRQRLIHNLHEDILHIDMVVMMHIDKEQTNRQRNKQTNTKNSGVTGSISGKMLWQDF